MLYMKQHQYAAHHAVYGNSMSYTAYYFTGIFYADVRQISMLFIDNKDSVFCIMPSMETASTMRILWCVWKQHQLYRISMSVWKQHQLYHI